MANPIPYINIPPVETVEELRRSVEVALNRYALSASDTKLVGALDANNYQIISLQDPTKPLDAVNLRSLNAAVDGKKGLTTGDVNALIDKAVPDFWIEVPSGTQDGSNTLFRLTYGVRNSPLPWLILFVNGIRQQAGGVDYTLYGSSSIIFTTAPASTDQIMAYYMLTPTSGTNGPVGGHSRYFVGAGDGIIAWGAPPASGLLLDCSAGAWIKLDVTAADGDGIICCLANNGNLEIDTRFCLALKTRNSALELTYRHTYYVFGPKQQYTFVGTAATLVVGSWKYVGFSRDVTAKTVTVYYGDGGGLSSQTWDYNNRSGTVDTSGTAVTLVGGQNFNNSYEGMDVVINGVTYTVSTVTDSTHLVLTGSAGTQSSKAYSIAYQQPTAFTTTDMRSGNTGAGPFGTTIHGLGGNLQEHYIFQRALTQTEHINLMLHNANFADTDMIVGCTISGNSPEVDSSSYGHSGTLPGTCPVQAGRP